MSFKYNDEGIRTSKTVNGVTTNYYLEGSRIIAEETNGNITVYLYNSTGIIGFQYHASSYGANVWDTYFYEKNLQGDIVAVYTSTGVKKISYAYDAWGKTTTTYYNGATASNLKNPFTYRGYYYDNDLGFYYLNSRYYDPDIGRWISSEPNVYTGAFDTGSGLIAYNVYAYCANNPINFSDPTGEFILTALIVGAVIGGAIGGTAAYNSSKSSGLVGSNLFWATAGGIGKGILIGGVAGGLVGVTGGVIYKYKATSIAGTAMITTTATIAAKATEVTALQAKKSTNDGDNGWQIANDCIDSVFSNSGKFISPVLTKASTTSATYIATDLIKHKVVPLEFNVFLHSNAGKLFPYSFAAYAWGHTVYSIFCADPIARANQRRIGLR